MKRSLRQRPKGVALVEVLVAMLVVSVGVLAMAGLLATASRYGKTSEFRAVATLLATDMADRIRANKDALRSNVPTPGSVTAYNVTGDYSSWETEPGDPQACANVNECTAAELAARDIAEWSRSVFSSLPGGAGYVSVAQVGDAGAARENFAADIWIAWLDPDADSGLPAADKECPPDFEVTGSPQPRCAFFRVGL
ncbi:type IV pilus modification protein PilV [Ideonella sp.]|uniref:type IV pilus modification protein PilV n=1 Tax=Ideonella sp. TaxID=1929293 RepID=UPI0035B2990C